jgi:hypothetical protein
MAKVEKQDGGSKERRRSIEAEAAERIFTDKKLEKFANQIRRKSEANQLHMMELKSRAEAFEFERMASIIPCGQRGNAAINHFEVAPEHSHMTELKAMFNDAMYYVQPGIYARLMIDGSIMMTDTLFERATAYEFLCRAHGKVLIAGLGLGMVLFPLIQKPEVEEVLVLEKFEDVYNLVWFHVCNALYQENPHHPAVNVRIADAFEWKPRKGEKFDVIWHDIWHDISDENLPQVTKLKRRYGQWLNRSNPNRWQGAWVEQRLRRMRREYNRGVALMESIKRGTLGGDPNAELSGSD